MTFFRWHGHLSQVRKADTQMIPDAAAGDATPEEDEDDEDEGMMPDEEV